MRFGLTVCENIAVGAYLRHARRADATAKAREVARRVGLGAELDRPAGGLTVAGRKRLELARALATEPKLLLLDEVLAGLNPSEIRDIIPVIRGIRDEGVTILMIEHVMQAVMNLCERVYVLAQGRMIAEGPPAAVCADARVIERLLEISGLKTGYGATEVLRGIDMAVHAGEIVTVLGSNGVGKTTLNKVLSGVLSPWTGEIRFGGTRIDGKSAARIVEEGLIQVPEGRKIFPNLSIRENLELGSYRRGKPNRARNLERIFATFPRLKEREAQFAGTLSGGEQQMLAIGRGMMAEPRLLILDE
ncbi:hypothetical protein OROMI_014965, partial [Orobanche minor]